MSQNESFKDSQKQPAKKFQKETITMVCFFFCSTVKLKFGFFAKKDFITGNFEPIWLDFIKCLLTTVSEKKRVLFLLILSASNVSDVDTIE